MLSQSQVTCMLPVKDLARARRFYEERLGLEPDGLRPDGKFIYRCGGTEVALLPKDEGTKAEHTALGFKVDNSSSAITTLKARGVKFADYGFPGFKTINHVCVLGSEKAAWFEVTEGNTRDLDVKNEITLYEIEISVLWPQAGDREGVYTVRTLRVAPSPQT